MCKIVILRGLIGGFGFSNYYYALSMVPLGDATTFLSLYPVLTIFLARVALGEEIKPLHLLAEIFRVVGATLIGCFMNVFLIKLLFILQTIILMFVTSLSNLICPFASVTYQDELLFAIAIFL